MTLKHLEPRLRVKEHELLSTLAALGGGAETQNYTDDATSVLTATLEEVRDALNRLERADYGKCVRCGLPIEPSRLHAIPWTPYCLEHQEELDLKTQPDGSVLWQSA
jgi:RNA polymerase-binding transcription factor DksA